MGTLAGQVLLIVNLYEPGAMTRFLLVENTEES